MPEHTPPEFVVIMIAPGDERFVIVDREDVLSVLMRSVATTNTTAERMAPLVDLIHARPSLTEPELRVQLAARGVAAADADRRIQRARNMVTMDGAGPFVFERITRIGYVNDDGQEVVRKTGRDGPSSQRVFVMRCRVCSHEYGAYGCDVDSCRCPACQDGRRGPAC